MKVHAFKDLNTSNMGDKSDSIREEKEYYESRQGETSMVNFNNQAMDGSERERDLSSRSKSKSLPRDQSDDNS